MPNIDLAARRDARKRKILENSQQRLSKIISCDKNKVVSGEVTDVSNKGSNRYNGTASESRTHERLERPSTPEPVVHTKIPDEIDPVLEKCFDEISRFPSSVHVKDDNFVENTEPPSQQFWVHYLFIICLSIGVRLMYQFNMSSLFVECLFIPFITISFAKIAANPRKRVTKPTMYENFITGVLFLCGVQGKLLDIPLYMHMFVDLCNDFALYLFSFIMTHVFLESFVIR